MNLNGTSQVLTGEWFPTSSIIPEHDMSVQMIESQQALLTEDISVLLSMAVEFGKVGFDGQTVEVKYAGCGKVLAVR